MNGFFRFKIPGAINKTNANKIAKKGKSIRYLATIKTYKLIFHIFPSKNSVDKLVGEKIHLRKSVDLQVAYSRGETPALVFLHGGLGNRFNWR